MLYDGFHCLLFVLSRIMLGGSLVSSLRVSKMPSRYVGTDSIMIVPSRTVMCRLGDFVAFLLHSIPFFSGGRTGPTWGSSHSIN